MNREEFFLKTAGCGEDGAARLALAEQWFEDQTEYVYSVEPDPDPDLSFMDEEERSERSMHEVVGVAIHTRSGAGFVLTKPDYKASVWGIVDPDDDYLRVIRAELALEVMPEGLLLAVYLTLKEKPE